MKDDKTKRTSLIIVSLLLLVVAVFVIIAAITCSSGAGIRKYIVTNEINLGSSVESEAVPVTQPAPVIDVEVITTTPSTPQVEAEVTPEVKTIDIEIDVDILPKTETRVIPVDINVIGSGLKTLDSEVLIKTNSGEYINVKIPQLLVYGSGDSDKSYEIKPEVNAREIQPGVITAEVVLKNVDGTEIRIIVPSFRKVGDGKSYEIEAEVLERAVEAGLKIAQHYAAQHGIKFEILEEEAKEPAPIKAEILVEVQIKDKSGDEYKISLPSIRRIGKDPAEKSYDLKAEILEKPESVIMIAEIILDRGRNAGRYTVSIPDIRRIGEEPVDPSYDMKAEVIEDHLLNPGFKYTELYKLSNGMRVEVLEDKPEVAAEVLTEELVIMDEEPGRSYKVEIPEIRRIGREPAEKTYDIRPEILDKKKQVTLDITLLYHYDIESEVIETTHEPSEVIAEVMHKEEYEVPEIIPEVLLVVDGVRIEVPEIRRIGREPAEKPYKIAAVVKWDEKGPVLAEVIEIGKNRYGIAPEVSELMLAEVSGRTYSMIVDIMFDKYEAYEIKSEILSNPFGISPEILAPTDNPYGMKAELISNQYGISPEILSDGSYARYMKAEVIKYEYEMPYVMTSELLIEPESESTEFGVMDVRFSESKIFTELYLSILKKDAMREYEGMEVLTHILNEVNSQYISRGYPNAYAYLPEQIVDDGVFYVKLIEGVIGKVILENNKYTNDVYILSHFHLVPGDLFDIADLEQQLLLYNKWAPGVAITARLEPGEEEGSTDIILTAHELNPTEVMVSGDNYGSAGYGEYRAGATVSMNSLTKNRDILSYGATLSQGTLNVFADYSLLTPKLDIRMGIKGTYGQSMVSTIYEEYLIKGESRSYALYTTIPLQRTLSTQFSFSLSGNYSYSKAAALDPEVIISEEVVTNIMAGFSQIVTTDNIYAYGTANMTFGIPYYDALSDYLKADAIIGFRLGDLFGFYLTGKTQVQFVLDSGNLPKSLDMQVGGSSTVRGYKERCAWGREGLLSNLEFHIGFEPNVLDVFGFLDFAYIRPYPDTGENFMLSAGVGASITFAKHLVFNVAAGFPQIALSVQDPNADDQCRVHLGLSLNF